MIHRPILTATLLAVCLAAIPAGGRAQPADDATAIRDLFTRYKSALLGGDGATASRLVDAETFAYFEEIKQLTLSGSEQQVKARPFVDRLLIITMRHELPAADLEVMDLEGLLKHAIDAGWIGKQAIMGLGIGEVTVDGDQATAVAITAGQAPADQVASELQYRFVRQDGEWRFGFRSLVASINQMIAQLTTQMGTDQDALIFVLVEQLSGRKVLPEVWSLTPPAAATGAQSASPGSPAGEPTPTPPPPGS